MKLSTSVFQMSLSLRPIFIMKACYPGQTSEQSLSRRIRPDPVPVNTVFLSDRERMEGPDTMYLDPTGATYEHDYQDGHEEEFMEESDDAMDEDEEADEWVATS